MPIIPLYFKGRLSEEILKQQIETFLMAGYETTASTISFTILLLAMHPHIQDEVFLELLSVYDTQNEETTNEHIQKLHRLNRVIKESMRLLPVGSIIERTATADIPLRNCILPKNTIILMSFYTMHRVRIKNDSKLNFKNKCIYSFDLEARYLGCRC